MLKPSPFRLGFQHHPWGPVDVNAKKNMFDPYIDNEITPMFGLEIRSSDSVNYPSNTKCVLSSLCSLKPLRGIFAISEDPHEMQHNAAFHLGLHFLLG